MSVFYFHPDTVAKYKKEEIQRNYKVLRRYDLSVEDIQKLKNKNDVPVITYPPTEATKDIKMYPPYGK
jgi:3-deoxy-D-arabino-heptulosonate 7-phosphate (DAHP) synthase